MCRGTPSPMPRHPYQNTDTYFDSTIRAIEQGWSVPAVCSSSAQAPDCEVVPDGVEAHCDNYGPPTAKSIGAPPPNVGIYGGKYPVRNQRENWSLF